ncbi:UDP-N-acetylglucosamine 2-epimerase (hydrolyzing) [archaeon]|jgi:GDP/UDP-N,N'-diacetylbacillosamine 2-epimerase (hydrolysing)|nr:UDP-N-acetylglucosamine 2-epimerase (hydrolyzing) [archaeon]MBT6820970.1 UDP-N-acetylglucosamine 2-epimerase (hydrolyzing) [archaeon]MBT7392162.1 UDP-N-acetylglucosamine 2-epimerase (hydrolyzing) [archaeon]
MKNKIKTVCYISGSRADYGLMKRTLIELRKDVNLHILVTGMHLKEEFGNTINNIINDGFKYSSTSGIPENDDLKSMLICIQNMLGGFIKEISKINPDLIFVEGDRSESLVGSLTGAFLNIPIIHQGGGDLSGSIDNKIRYAVTSFSDYHFVGNSESFSKIINLGMDKTKIFNFGEPGLDDIYLKNYLSKEETCKKYNIDLSKKNLVFMIHPDTKEIKKSIENVKKLLNYFKNKEYNIIAIYGNSDSGGRKINEILLNFSKNNSNLNVHKNLNREDYLGIINICNLMIGNSSSGIIELPSFRKPFILVGNRQKNRLKANNVLELDDSFLNIDSTFTKALTDQKFKDEIKKIINPYGDGTFYLKATQQILKILEGK